MHMFCFGLYIDQGKQYLIILVGPKSIYKNQSSFLCPALINKNYIMS